MCLRDILVSYAPEHQKEIEWLLSLRDFLYGARIKGTITQVRCVMLEELPFPVIVAVGGLKEGIVRNRNVLCTFNFGVLMAIVIDNVPTAMHHLTELECLLCIGAGGIVLSSHCVGDRQNMKSQLYGAKGCFWRTE